MRNALRLRALHLRSGCVAFFLIFMPVVAEGQSASPETKAAGAPSVVKGRVVLSDGKGLQGVAVVLMPADFSPERKPAARATTDGDGNYTMTNVAAGRYSLQTLTPAYTSSDSPSGNLTGSGGKMIDLAPGETVENQNITLVRGGVITGRVVDAEGKPVIEQAVTVAVAEGATVGRPVVPPFFYQTDDRGVYRIYGLPAGRYLVSVGQDKNSQMVMVGAGAGNRYPRTFHPNALEAAQAKVIEVTTGNEASGIDIALAARAKTFEATGRIVDGATGKPVAGVMYGYGAVRPDGKTMGAFGSEGTKSDADGVFRLKNLLPGRYGAIVFGGFENSSENYSEPASFEIVDSDVSGLVIKVRKGASVSGVAVLEGTTDPAVLARLSQLSLSVNVTPLDPKAEALRAPSYSNARLKPDGSFRIAGLPPGKVQITLGGFPPPKGFTLLRIEHNDVEVRNLIEVGAGEQLTGVRVRLAYGTSIVRGQIQVRSDGVPAQLPIGTRLVVALRRAGAPLAESGSFNIQADERGRFTFEGLAAGDYELQLNGWLVTAPGTPSASRLPTHKQTINVPDGGELNLNLVYDLTAKKPETTP